MVNKVDLHKQICESLNVICAKKNADYNDSFGKARKEIPNYTLGKLYDKFERYRNLSQNKERQVKDESLMDTLFDLANYCIMEAIELELENTTS